MRRMIEVLRTTPRVIWQLSAVLVAVGLCGLVVGSWVETQGFWTGRPFLTNVASSLATALFGIPFALVMISSLTDVSLRYRTRVTLQNDLRDTSQRMYDQMSRLAVDERDPFRATENIVTLSRRWSTTKERKPETLRWQWTVILRHPIELRAILQLVRDDWGFLRSQRNQTLSVGFAWLHKDREQVYDGNLDRCIDLLGEIASGWDDEWGWDKVDDACAQALPMLAQLHGQAVHVRNTFLFGRAPIN